MKMEGSPEARIISSRQNMQTRALAEQLCKSHSVTQQTNSLHALRGHSGIEEGRWQTTTAQATDTEAAWPKERGGKV